MPGTAASVSAAPAEHVDTEVLERVYVWDIVVRLTHWVVALSILILAFTGIYIGRPFYIPMGPVDEQFVMGTVKIVHFYTAIVFTLAVLVRVGWMIVGPRYARWDQFVPASPRRRKNVLTMLSFYTFFRRDPPLNVGHNPLAGLTYLTVFALYFVMILTGLALYSVDAGVSYMRVWGFLLPVFGGAQTARLIHHVTMWLILGFFAHHIWSAILMSRYEGHGLIDSMFSGYKFLPRGWRDRDE
ncbi:MAG: Ni/Fe-hydrogenase, b-type cytochrome subunit [Myxococcota bacterium]